MAQTSQDASPTVDAPSPSGASTGPRAVRHARRATVAASGRAVCVRLCDGFFFPSAVTSGGDEACASQCPDAPTAIYYQRSDGIDDAVSARGELYSALPVANRNQAAFDETCSCHKSLTRSYVADLLRDRTLRNGDLLMTPNGFTVFRSGKSSAVSQSDFVTLSKASDVPKSARAELTAMEHAGVWDRQFGAYSYSSPPEAASATPRPRKGMVTVDDGESAR